MEKINSEGLYNLCSTPNTIGVIKPRRIIWVEHVIHTTGDAKLYRAEGPSHWHILAAETAKNTKSISIMNFRRYSNQNQPLHRTIHNSN
jgi:hypothetical protein